MSNKSRRKPSFTLHSETNKLKFQLSQLHNLEQSILKQYRKLAYSQQTIQYEIDSLSYIETTKQFPTHIRKLYKYSVTLEKFTFYEMFTILILEHLYSLGNNKKIKNLKKLIYSENFLEGNYYTKGLLIKGFRQLQNNIDKKCPIGDCLLKSDSIVAFSECWRQLVSKICIQNRIPIMSDLQIDSSIFQLFSCYFKINFDVYWKEKGSKFSKQRFTFADCSQIKSQEAPILAVIVNPTNQISVSQRSIRISESRISGKSSLGGVSDLSDNLWNYIILTNSIDRPPMEELDDILCVTPQKGFPKLGENQQISRISEVQYSYGQTEDIKNLLDHKILSSTASKKPLKQNLVVQNSLTTILQTMEKANKLIESVKSYSEYLQNVKI